MDALKALKPEKCKRYTISVCISDTTWCLFHFKADDISKLSGLRASVYGRSENLPYFLAASFSKHRTAAGIKKLLRLFMSIVAVLSIPAHPCHMGRRLQLAVPEPPQRRGGRRPGKTQQQLSPQHLQQSFLPSSLPQQSFLPSFLPSVAVLPSFLPPLCVLGATLLPSWQL